MVQQFRTTPPSRRLIAGVLSVAALLPCALGSTAARAADMSMPMKAAAVKPPVYQWTGCYVGINGGGGGASSNFTATIGAGSYLLGGDPTEASNDGSGSANISNVLGGGQAGCNWQSGTVVVGIEGDFDAFRSTSAFFNNTDTLPTSGNAFVIGQSLTTNYVATVRPRLGIAADRNFAYITGGAAFADAKYSESYSDGGGVANATVSKSLTGWAAGAGWEYGWTDHLTLRFEYLYTSFPSTSLNTVIVGPGGSNPLHGSADLVIQVARAALNYKF